MSNKINWIVTNGNKGIIISAQNADEARAKGNAEFYGLYTNKKDLNTVQVYEKEKHLFVHAKGNKIFAFIQYHVMGGVVTNYDNTIDTPPTTKQLEFLGREIIYTKFYNNRNLSKD